MKKVPDELDLHGLRVDEAIPLVDRFLHQSFKAGLYRVWIIHGKGTGVLRSEVTYYLKKHLSTRMVRVGEEITVSETKGMVSDINLTHTVLSIEDDVVFVPNSLVVSSIVKRKKRDSDKDAGIRDW